MPHRIDMVISAQLFFSLLCDGQRYISNHSEGLRPILQNTVLGWVVSGPVPIAPNSSHSASVALTCTTDDLDFQLSRFWEIEHCPEARSFSKEELAFEKLFSDTTTRDELGRFVVRLSTKPEMLSQLGDSATTALKRYHWMQRRLLRDPNHMSPANTSHPNSVFHPHHAVIKPTSTTTKCRVVFDGSSRTSTGIAINDCLMVGPTIQDTLVTIVIRFRFNEVALVADITKMFRQIWIHQSDRHLQQIYWKDENDINVRPYVLNTVTYGTACAPYLSTRCLKQLAYDHMMINKHVASKISTDFYMDDLISGDQTDDAAINLRSEVQGILGSAGFELRKWASNSPAVLASIPEALRDDRSFLDLDSSPSIKTLGLIWQPKSDSFHFKSPDLIQSQQLTKRSVVSEMAQLFDPLGILGPVVVKAKIFVQQLWRANLSWDDLLPPNLSDAWESYRSDLSTVHLFSVPRRVLANNRAGEIQLHGFCDASQHAYGACIYVRSSTEDGNIITHLLTAKSRVAPIQQSTIPRLELCSAVLLGHLYTNVISSLNQPTKAFFWSDSMITLHWIHQPPSKFNIYVANRVAEVQRLTVGGSWNHIAGFENPADIISRGATPQELSGNTLWWEGPPWLKLESTNWPRRFTVMDSSHVKPEDLEEKVQQKTSLAAVTTDTYPELCEYYSSFAKLVRISAICRRFAQRCRKQERDFPTYLLASEYRAALMGLVKSAQQQSFPRELALVEAGKKSDLRSSPLRRLNPIIDQGILRVGGRLNLSNLSHGRKHQIILPSNHKLTILLVESTHQDLLHAGPSLMIANIRERFWPLDLRRLARRTVRNCVTCNCVTVEIQLVGQLPRVRITPARAFLNTGVDFCGPVLIKLPVRRGKPFPPLKAYICVFVCMATKAMHLELVGDLSTDGFIAALKRFVGRRGLPISLYCDNATNFTGANRELRSLLSQFMDQQHTRKVASFCAEISIQFHFIPARAPSFGGLWEAAVRAVKHHLRRVVGLDAITAEAMQTVLCQIEGCLNSRPLTACSEDPDDQQILTPGHFLIGDALKAIPEPDLGDVPTNRLSLWQATQHKVQRFWKLWSTDYLNQLQQRSKNYFQKPNVVVGKLVLLKEDNLPPLKWSVGRITAVHPGADNLVRVVDVKVPSGAVYDRPISKICLLPINDAEDGPSSNNE
ncbi:uncharacterized protein LOC129737915 [Uranotaenia lowii]|uniref:uncharacterized protein LOC129737915 n=1 Tax=Uranotaenia lowii TaxID=190385 RepID=UPI0024795A6F|nr:uncharacterized protein LOC129737915 [Uranotaenia lowii]